MYRLSLSLVRQQPVEKILGVLVSVTPRVCTTQTVKLINSLSGGNIFAESAKDALSPSRRVADGFNCNNVIAAFGCINSLRFYECSKKTMNDKKPGASLHVCLFQVEP